MESLLELAAAQPTRALAPGEILIAQGREGGDLFVLESGQLLVERDGVTIASISSPNSVVGEMSVVLGTPNSATVRADGNATVRVIMDARKYLEQDQAMTFRLAWLMASRLDATSAYLVELSRQHTGKAEQNMLGKILSALHLQADDGHYSAVARTDMFGTDDTGGAYKD
jgi:CRP/FNR family transcriptional regulator, cyclic AMP receptor protein